MSQFQYTLSRPQKLYVVCAAVFLTALIVAEATSGKFFTAFHLPFQISILGQTFDRVTMTAGVLAFPVTFIMTDIINEYFGRKGIRFVTLVGMGMIVFEFILLSMAISMPTDPISPAKADQFNAVFGMAGRVILGSLTAYLIGQLVDISLFFWLRRLTDGKHLWLRATGSTFGSQFFDTFIVLTIAFAGQSGFTFQTILAITLFNYGYKFIIAIFITPIIYLVHWVIDQYLGREAAHDLVEQAEHEGAMG
ncbi:MAG: queuosine precursor transporter [Rhodothermia bacterium]|nr:queuosine precursor transporter [Rhodothermia bacterium]